MHGGWGGPFRGLPGAADAGGHRAGRAVVTGQDGAGEHRAGRRWSPGRTALVSTGQIGGHRTDRWAPGRSGRTGAGHRAGHRAGRAGRALVTGQVGRWSPGRAPDRSGAGHRAGHRAGRALVSTGQIGTGQIGTGQIGTGQIGAVVPNSAGVAGVCGGAVFGPPRAFRPYF